MPQDINLNVDDIKFMLDHKMALRHVSDKSHLELHAQPGGTMGDAYPLGNFKSVLPQIEQPYEDECVYKDRYDQKLKDEPQVIIDEFSKRLRTSIDGSFCHDAREGGPAASLKESHFLILKDMKKYLYGYPEQDIGSYAGTLGKCSPQTIHPEQICGVMSFTPEELKTLDYKQLEELVFNRCVDNIKTMRQEYEVAQKFESGPDLLQKSIKAVNERSGITSYKIGEFETKLSEITGMDFRHINDGFAMAQDKGSYDCATKAVYAQGLYPIVPTQIAVHPNGTDAELHIDKAKVDMEEFESFYQWKKQDIQYGVETAEKISAETGLSLQSKLGVVMLFDENSNAFANQNHKNEKIMQLQTVMAENGYEYSMRTTAPGETGGLVYTRQKQRAAVPADNKM